MAIILVVDDRPVDRKLLATLLRTQGHDIVEADDGEDALQALAKTRPHLIISDVLMPTLDGYAFVQRVRQIPTSAATPVLFYTAMYHEREARALAIRCGVTDILVKPSAPADILKAVESILAGRRPAATAAANADGTTAERQRDAALAAAVRVMASERNPEVLFDIVRTEARRVTLARSASLTIGTTAELSPTPVNVLAQQPPAAVYRPICSVLNVPVVSGSHVYGWLSLRNKLGADAFTRADERAATTLGAYAGITLEHAREVQELRRRISEFEERARRASGQTRRAKEEERARLSRMLHDELGQILAGLRMEIHALDSHAPAFNPTLTHKVESLIDTLERAIDTLRRFSSELRPAILDDLGLVAAVEWQTKEFERDTSIRCRLDTIVDQVKLDAGRAISIYRVVQEALTNVQRHAGATRVVVRMSEEDGRITVSVADNGKGIPTEALDTHSLGLLGMRERAELLGGTLGITRRRPRGTIVALTAPLADRRRVTRE